MPSRMKAVFSTSDDDFTTQISNRHILSLEAISNSLENNLASLDKLDCVKQSFNSLSLEGNSPYVVSSGVALEGVAKTIIDTILEGIKRIKEFIADFLAWIRKLIQIDDQRTDFIDRVILSNMKTNLEKIKKVIPNFKSGTEEQVIQSPQVKIDPEIKEEVVEYLEGLPFPQDVSSLFKDKSNSLVSLSSNVKNYYHFVDVEIPKVMNALFGDEIQDIYDGVLRVVTQFKTHGSKVDDGVKQFVDNNLSAIDQGLNTLLGSIPEETKILDNYSVVVDKTNGSFRQVIADEEGSLSSTSTAMRIEEYDAFIAKVKRRSSDRRKNSDEAQYWVGMFDRLNDEVARLIRSHTNDLDDYVVSICRKLTRTNNKIIHLSTQFVHTFIGAEHRVNNTMWHLVQYENRRFDKFCKGVFAGLVKTSNETIKRSNHLQTS